MELIRGLHNLRETHRGCVATIGNFDGVHLGHQAVLGQLSEQAARMHVPSVVISFEPQPLEYFAPDKAPARLTRFREKFEALRRFNVDRLLVLPFNRKLAQLPAPEFIQRILVAGLQVRYLVVGDDFRFGRGRTGDYALLQQAGRQHGFEVVNLHSFCSDGQRVSSTRIREAMQRGDLAGAAQLLGRQYRMSGRVAHGDKIGRQLGYPTANIHIRRKTTPLHGIFVVEVFGLPGEPLPGVASLGTRPTVNGKKMLLEVYLFDFAQDIYGRHLQVGFLHKLRDELRFTSLDALKMQIDKDVAQAKQYFATQHSTNPAIEKKLN